MALDFYFGSGSPFAWKVWLVLEHKGIPYTAKRLSFDADETRKPEFLAINPRGRVPTIVDDGFALYESNAICEYLEEQYPQKPLLPKDAKGLAEFRKTIGTALRVMTGSALPAKDEIEVKSPSEGKTGDGITIHKALLGRKGSGEAIPALGAVPPGWNGTVVVWVHPEGTRNRGVEKLLPFKKGLFHMAIAAQVPVVPIVNMRLFAYFDYAKRRIYKGEVLVRVLEPIPTKGMTSADVPRLMEEVRSRMQAELDKPEMKRA